MTTQLSELNAVASQLSPELVQRVIDFARGLKTSVTTNLEMGELTEQEMREESLRAIQRFEEEHPGEDWGQVTFTPGYK